MAQVYQRNHQVAPSLVPSSSSSRGQRIDSSGGGDKGKSVGNVFSGGRYGNYYNFGVNASGRHYCHNAGSNVGRFGMRARQDGRI